MAIDWYPDKLADRVAWHANFASRAGSTGTGLGMTAAQVTQTGLDSTMVAQTVNYLEEVENFHKAFTAFKDIVLQGPMNAAMPTAPVPPNELEPAGAAKAFIEARTRQYAAIIKASPNYTEEAGEHFGIIPTAPGGPTTPTLKPTALTSSQVSLAVGKGGYSVVAIDSRTAGGAWSQIGVAMTTTYVDNRPPTTPGAPELREYRAQGMQNNVRVGALSTVVSAVTVP